jgi:hypothetical protein
MRGLAKVTVEFSLANTGMNLQRMWRVMPTLTCTA